MGIEPTWPAWKAGTLPLSYTHNRSYNNTKHLTAARYFLELKRNIWNSRMLNDNINRTSQNCRLLILTSLLARLTILASRYSKVLTISKNVCWLFRLAAAAFTAQKSFSRASFLPLRPLATLASQSARLCAFPAHVRAAPPAALCVHINRWRGYKTPM